MSTDHIGAIHKGYPQMHTAVDREGEGGLWNEDVHILKNFASSFLKLLKQGIVYVIESRWHVS